MELYNAIERRYSVRSYSDRAVEDEKLKRILKAGVDAPTAVNFQPFKILVIKTQGKEDELGRIYKKSWFAEPPYVLLVCIEKGKEWTRRDGKTFGDIDGAIVMDHMILAATAEGLGTCWVGAFDEEAAREILGLGDDLEPLVFTPLGYATGDGQARAKKSIDELVEYR